MTRLAARLGLLSILVWRHRCVTEIASGRATLVVVAALVLVLVLIGIDEAA